MAAEILQEFLVNVRYAVDKTSEGHFLDSLKKAATSVLGINVELVGMGAGLVELTRRLSDVAEQFYWMGQRMDLSSVAVTSITEAMEVLGVSSGAAVAGLEGFAHFVRSYGPAAQGFLHAFGVTAQDTEHQLLQFGETLRKMGGADPKSPGYWMALRVAERAGISDEMFMRALATGKFAKSLEERRDLTEKVFGKKQDPEEWIAKGHEMAEVFSSYGSFFADIRRFFSLQLFDKMLPPLKQIFDTLTNNKPLLADLRTLMIGIATAAGALFRGISLLITVFVDLFDLLDKIPHKMWVVEGVLAAIGLAMMRSPFGRVILILSTLLGLLDDYLVWKAKGYSLFDWGKLQSASDWIKGITGIKDALLDVLEVLVAISFAASMLGGFGKAGGLLWRLGKRFLGFAPAAAEAVEGAEAGAGMGATFARGARGVAGRAAAGIGGRLAGRAALAGIPVVGEIALGLWAAYDAWNAAKAAGWDPAKHGPAKWGEDAGKWVRELFTGDHAEKAVKDGAEGFWDLVKDTWKTLTENQADFDPTSGSAHGPQTLWERVTQSAGGSGPSGAAAGAGELGVKLMQQLGVSANIAAAFLSNFQAESGLRSDITYGGGGYNPQSNRAYGLAQWAGSRLADLRKFAAERHLDITQQSTQLAFMKQELGGRYAGTLAKLRAAEARGASRDELADIVFEEYEAGHAAELQKYRGGHKSAVDADYNDIVKQRPALPTEHPATSAQTNTTNSGGNTINHTVNVSVPPQANPAATANAVAGEQTRAHGALVRDVTRVVR